jgi:carbon storage regulator
MLVLTRKPNEQLVIDGNIVITILGIDRGKVRVGIDAPKDKPVHRREVWDLIQSKEKDGQPDDAGAGG